MRDDEGATRCHGRVMLGLGVSLGVVIGIAVGSAVALRFGTDAVEAMRGLLDRLSGRGNQVNFELLLQ